MGTQRVHNVLQKGGADGWAPCGEGRTVRSAGSCGGECGRLRLRTRGGGRARPLHRAGAATDGRPPANARSPSSGWLAWSETPRQYCSPREDGYQDEPCAAAPPAVARTRRPGAVDSRARRLAQENGKSIGGRPPWSGGGWHGSLRAIQGNRLLKSTTPVLQCSHARSASTVVTRPWWAAQLRHRPRRRRHHRARHRALRIFRIFDGWAAAERSGSHVSTCEPLHEHLHVLGLRWEGRISLENVRRYAFSARSYFSTW